MKTYIIGHSKPDTDAVVSAIAYAELVNSLGQTTTQVVPTISDPLNPETSFVFETFKAKKPQLLDASMINPDDEIVLVDHNEESQRLPGLPQDQITAIIDHHKLHVNFSQPIAVMVKTWGSTSTIIYSIMKSHAIQPSQTTAALMLCAILSDTVGFKSSTTTDIDIELAKELATIAEVTDIDALTLDLFKAKSNISQLSDIEIVKNDYKVFDFSGKKVMIDQLETVEQSELLSTKKEALLSAMASVKTELQADLLFVVISDILQVNSKLLILGDEEAAVATKAFGGTIENQTLDIGPKLSRKKEIAPAIEQACK